MPRAPIRSLPTSEWLTFAAPRGMRDARGPLTTSAEFAFDARNVYVPAGVPAQGYVGRPPFAQAQATQLGASGVRAGQGGITWTLASGVRQTVAIVGGKVYTYNWSTGAWAESVNAATLSAATVTLSTTARVALVPFGSVLVVSDGVNAPWVWTGATNSGVTRIPDVGAWYGKPTVYYSKLFAISAGARQTMVWSEENDPLLGYDVGGYNNAWDNPGGYTAPLTALAGTNDALYVFRERVALTITGAVNADFQTAGTRASLSETTGTASPWAVEVIPRGPLENAVAFLDVEGRPHVAIHGDGVTPTWADCAETVRMVPRTVLPNALALYDGATECMLFGLPATGQTWPTQWLAFGTQPYQFHATWGWDEASHAAWATVDGEGYARWMHTGVDDGRVYVHARAGAAGNDALASGDRYIAHQVTGPLMGFDPEQELRLDQVEVVTTGTTQSTLSISYETSRGRSTPLVMPLSSSGGGGFVLGAGVLGSGILATEPSDRRVRAGLMGRGRWVRATVAHQEDAEDFGLALMRLRAFRTSGHASVP